MSALTSPKGPLPARVYWVRRLLLLTTVFLLVFATSRLVGGDDRSETAAQTAASQEEPAQEEPPAGEAAADPAAAGAPEDTAGETKEGEPEPAPTPDPTPEPPPLPEPSGPCEAADVVVTPTVADTIASDGLTIDLEFRTKVTDACTFTVSPETVTATITSGPDDIWSSQQCPAAIPSTELVVRNVEGTGLPIVWGLRRSDAECSGQTEWARLGWYHVATAALGGEPTSVQFELARQPEAVVTEKPADAKKSKKKAVDKKSKKKSKKKREHRAGDDGDGTAEPNG